ncbi:hypothetical protein L4C39_19305 [Vibrio clamense]|uniref:hypothetical protein n=1 Tax=Vibrio clamense TaxID=2910254 RepID=UPI003D194DFA
MAQKVEVYLKLVIENIELVLAMDNLIVSIATLLTAVFTCLAAISSVKAVKVANNSYSVQSNQYRLEEFYKLLDSLERAHGVCFLQRGTLLERIKVEADFVHHYNNFTAMVNNGFKHADKGRNVNHFISYIAFADRISRLFNFEYIIPANSEYVLKEHSGQEFPIRKNNPNWVGQSADTIAREILQFYGIDISLELDGITGVVCDGGYEELKLQGNIYSYSIAKNEP